MQGYGALITGIITVKAHDSFYSLISVAAVVLNRKNGWTKPSVLEKIGIFIGAPIYFEYRYLKPI